MKIEAARDDKRFVSIFSVIVDDDELLRLSDSPEWRNTRRMFDSPLISSKLYALAEMASLLEKMEAEKCVKAIEAGSVLEVGSIILSKPQDQPDLIRIAIRHIKQNECGMRLRSNCLPVCMASGNVHALGDRNTNACNGRLDCPAFMPNEGGDNQ